MTMSRPRHPLAAGLGLASAAGLLLLAACEMPRPTEIAPAGEMPLASIRSGGAYTVSGQLTPAAVREAVAAVLVDSDATAALGTPVDLYFVADASGRVVHAEYQRRRSTMRLAPTRRDGATAERTRVDSVRVRMHAGAPKAPIAGAAVSVRAMPLPGAVASLDPAAIGSVEVLKARPGDVVADSANVIWVTLKEGATLESAQAAGAASAARRARVEAAEVTARAEAEARGGAAAGAVRLRSQGNDVTGSSEPPLYVVDGVLIERGTHPAVLRDLDPNDIDKVEVLKGSAATEQYGDDGRHGVIQITLKKR